MSKEKRSSMDRNNHFGAKEPISNSGRSACGACFEGDRACRRFRGGKQCLWKESRSRSKTMRVSWLCATKRKLLRYYGGLVEPDETFVPTISGNGCRHLILGWDSFVFSHDSLVRRQRSFYAREIRVPFKYSLLCRGNSVHTKLYGNRKRAWSTWRNWKNVNTAWRCPVT